MLDVAFDELPCGGAQEMASSLLRVCECQRRAILKLVAEAVGAACLIEGGARHDAAGQRLIEQPAVQQDIHRAIGGLDLNRAEQCPPMLRHLVQNGVEIGRPVAVDEGRGFFGMCRIVRGTRRLRSTLPRRGPRRTAGRHRGRARRRSHRIA